jgi:hypothetical protein
VQKIQAMSTSFYAEIPARSGNYYALEGQIKPAAENKANQRKEGENSCENKARIHASSRP